MTQTQRLDVRELINNNPLSRFQKLVVFRLLRDRARRF
jgi:AAHS family 4-hydroxybenzoate transporter-like MFS transporter